MTVHPRIRGTAGLAVVATLVMSGCSTATPQTDTEASSSSDAAAASVAPAPPETPAPATSEVPVPAGVVGAGCADYVVKVPTGPGSIDGMLRDPVAIAVSNSPQLTTLAGALSGKLNSEVNLFDTLNKGQYTVFAPTDDAFTKVDPALIDKFKNEAGQLTSTLNYHVVPGELDPSAVVGEHKTLQGQTVKVTGSGDSLRVNDAAVVCGGIKTANATVYLVDTVLTPPPATPPPPPATPGNPDTSATPTPTP